jgi:hypothetical protein
VIPKEIKEINQVANPQAGVSTPARKVKPEGENGENSFKYRSSTDNKVTDAAEVSNAAKNARKPQMGHGDSLQDDLTHSNSGSTCSATDPGNYKEK